MNHFDSSLFHSDFNCVAVFYDHCPRYASNIVFSNGNLDPWYPAGVSTEALIAAEADQESVVALLIDRGGHHVDLFSADENDPESVTEARALEEEHIKRWIGVE